jgi:hypothetical protein
METEYDQINRSKQQAYKTTRTKFSLLLKPFMNCWYIYCNTEFKVSQADIGLFRSCSICAAVSRLRCLELNRKNVEYPLAGTCGFGFCWESKRSQRKRWSEMFRTGINPVNLRTSLFTPKLTLVLWLLYVSLTFHFDWFATPLNFTSSDVQWKTCDLKRHNIFL